MATGCLIPGLCLWACCYYAGCVCAASKCRHSSDVTLSVSHGLELAFGGLKEDVEIPGRLCNRLQKQVQLHFGDWLPRWHHSEINHLLKLSGHCGALGNTSLQLHDLVTLAIKSLVLEQSGALLPMAWAS